MCRPGERRELGGLVQHRVARDQRGHEHVAADEVRVVPRRDVGDHAQRLVRDPLLELLRRIGEDLLVAQRADRLRDEEFDPGGEAGRSLRAWRIGLPTSCVSVRASVSCIAPIRSRNFSIASSRLRIGTLAQRTWPARATSYLRRTAAALSAATSAMTAPVAGLVIFMGAPGIQMVVGGGLVLRGRGEEVVEDRRVVDEGGVVGRVELRMPLDGEHVGRTRVANRLDDAIRLRPGLDDQVAAETLIAWWWIEFVLTSVVPGYSRARPLPGTNDVAWQFRS